MDEVKVEVARGSGPGGQHRNVTESTVRVVHVPSGISATADGRSQYQNRRDALEVLTRRLATQSDRAQHGSRNAIRQNLLSESRAFTWTGWRDEVLGPNNSRTSMRKALKGKLDPLMEPNE